MARKNSTVTGTTVKAKKKTKRTAAGRKNSGRHSLSPAIDPGRRDVLELGREVISLELDGIKSLLKRIGPDFEKAVRLLLDTKGKVIVCGIGKSGIVARKIAATLSSTGTPAVYLHPVEAGHGDMGMVTEKDVFLAVSKSGSNEELTKLLPYIKAIKVKMISITANADSPLAGESDIVLPINVGKEACPMDMVPTTSTTAAMVLGDALAVAAFRSRDFGKEDYAKLHPSGAIGRRMLVTVGELMHSGGSMPEVDLETTLRDALFEIVNKRLGCTAITDRSGKLAGIITDGDLKRILLRDPAALDHQVSAVMTKNPRTTSPEVLAIDALEQMEMNKPGPITMLFVTDKAGRPVGVVHIHDIIRAGLK
jgi:arabinose-5-phosphate isomerase